MSDVFLYIYDLSSGLASVFSPGLLGMLDGFLILLRIKARKLMEYGILLLFCMIRNFSLDNQEFSIVSQ